MFHDNFTQNVCMDQKLFFFSPRNKKEEFVTPIPKGFQSCHCLWAVLYIVKSAKR